MLLVKTKIQPSNIAGLGLFADQFISKGTIVWKFEPKLDILLSEEEIEKLSSVSQEQFYNYAYFDSQYQKYLLCGDDARFFNHSDDPNCYDQYELVEDVTLALKDIEVGEELTCNYKSFYGNIEDIKTLK